MLFFPRLFDEIWRTVFLCSPLTKIPFFKDYKTKLTFPQRSFDEIHIYLRSFAEIRVFSKIIWRNLTFRGDRTKFVFSHCLLTNFAFYPWSSDKIRILSADLSQNSGFFPWFLNKIWDFFYKQCRICGLTYFFFKFRNLICVKFLKNSAQNPLRYPSSPLLTMALMSKMIFVYNTVQRVFRKI